MVCGSGGSRLHHGWKHSSKDICRLFYCSSILSCVLPDRRPFFTCVVCWPKGASPSTGNILFLHLLYSLFVQWRHSRWLASLHKVSNILSFLPRISCAGPQRPQSWICTIAFTHSNDLILVDFNLVVGWSIRQTTKFNSPPNFRLYNTSCFCSWGGYTKDEVVLSVLEQEMFACCHTDELCHLQFLTKPSVHKSCGKKGNPLQQDGVISSCDFHVMFSTPHSEQWGF